MPSPLQERFGIPGVRFEEGQGGLTRIAVSTPQAEAHIYLHGAHVAHWKPAGAEPVLFMSAESMFQDRKPIRGGVPVCWPWFGANKTVPNAPSHGVARLIDWAVESVRRDDRGRILVALLLKDDDFTRSFWPHSFELRHTVTVGPTLTLSLETRNTGKGPFVIAEALHTYFRVSDIRKVRVTGLEGTEYIDTVGGACTRGRQGREPIAFEAETDRDYVNTRAATVLHDPGLDRRITIEKSGSDSTVVWNPWITKSKAMPDFGDDEWPFMLCVETANAGENAATVAPGAVHAMEARIRVQ